MHGRRPTILTIAGFAAFLSVNAFVLWGGYLPMLPPGFEDEASLSAIFIPQTIALVATLLAASMLTGYMAHGVSHGFLVASSASLMGGVIMQALVTPADSGYLLPLSGIAIGCGSAGFFLLWEMILTAQDREHAEVGLIAASALFPLIYASMELLLHDHLRILVPALIVAAAMLLVAAYRDCTFDAAAFHQPPRSFGDNHGAVAHDIWRPMICVASLGFVAGILRATALSGGATGKLINELSMVAVVASAFLLLLLWRGFHLRFDLTRFYQIVFPLVAAGFVLFPFMGSVYHNIFAGVAYFFFSLVSMLMMLSCADLARTREVHPVFVYGLFGGCVYLLMGIGSIVGGYIGSLQEFGIAQAAMIALFTLYLLSLVLFASRGRKTGEESEVVVVESTRDLLAERCALLARGSGLSPRETEILELMVRGRDVPHIASSLFISENTVRSHAKNIYRKIDVHTKQELLSRVDSVDIGTGPDASSGLPTA